MSSVVQFTDRHPRLARLLGWIILNRVLMRFVYPPLVCVWTFAYTFFGAFGPKPRFKVPPGTLFPPGWPDADRMNAMMALLIARVREERSSPANAGIITERDRAVIQSMTWGTAGAAVLIVVAIATSSKQFTGPAISVAAAFFAAAIPLLIAFGFAFAHQWDPVRAPPTPQERGNLGRLIITGQFLFASGIASLLWSFDPRVFAVFLVAWFLGWRAFKNLVVHRIAPKTAEEITNELLKAKSAATTNQATPGGGSG